MRASKFRAALAAAFLGNNPHRTRDAQGVAERHVVRLRRLSVAWPLLGFTANPAEAAGLAQKQRRVVVVDQRPMRRPDWLPEVWELVRHPTSTDKEGRPRLCYKHSVCGKIKLNKSEVLAFGRHD